LNAEIYSSHHPLNRNDAFGCGLRSRALYYFPHAFPLGLIWIFDRRRGPESN
jgi:hypothetical protein